MTVFINDQQTDVILENEKNLGDFLRAFEIDCAENDATITGICVDGCNIEAEYLENAFSQPLNTISTIALSTVSLKDIKTALADISTETAVVAEDLTNLSVLLRKGKDEQAAQSITHFTTIFQNMCRVLTLTSLFPSLFNELQIEGEPILNYLKSFEQILSDFESAYARKDTVLIGDLAEYEIAPRLQSIISIINTVNGQTL